MTIAPSEIKRLVFREVLPGDTLKFAAKSNKQKAAGGGARDFRYRPYNKFDNIFGKILKQRSKVTRRRNKKSVSVGIYYDNATLVQNGINTPKVLEFEPPTTARKGEGRLTKLSSLGLSVPKGEGRVYLLVWQTGDDKVWFGFATQTQLEAKAWFKEINDFLLACMHAHRRAGNAAQGFMDFETSHTFCNSSK
jgi:hypothetical protein